MPSYKAPIETMQFVFHDVLKADETLQRLGFTDATPDTIDAYLDAAAKFTEEVLQPLNLSGDTEGLTYENGVVRTPKGFKEAYDQFLELGFNNISISQNYGGQGMPHILSLMVEEFICSANLSFGTYPGLTGGAIAAIDNYGEQWIKDLYIPKMTAGRWSGTMNLTEPHCGTDLGLIRTKADPVGDGTYKINGTKIFITAGEHDMVENIIHLVLAKLPDAPPGVKGISLFVVPKFLPKQDAEGEWVPGERNGVRCGSIEKKMGIKASATCVMNYDDATGWLVGEPNKGLRAMFTMMNAARLGVAIQGHALAEVSYQNALAYAKDRLQGRSLTGPKAPEKDADPIIVHPDVRKNLLTMKAFSEGARAFYLWAGLQLDVLNHSDNEEERVAAEDTLSLVVPILKAYLTDMGLESTVLGQQILGGHGYIHEWGMEQFVRDARIAQIYEGANGIQALDLVGRKLPMHMGRLLRRFFHPVSSFIETELNNPAMAEFIAPLAKAFGRLQQATGLLAQKGMKNPDEAGAASTDYLRLFAITAVGYMWCLMVKTAQEKLADSAAGNQVFYESKLHTARFFMTRVMPDAQSLFQKIQAGAPSLMDVPVEAF